jgi:hypothetical protein
MAEALNSMQGREIPRPLPCPAGFDPRAAWRGLPPASRDDLDSWLLVLLAGHAGTEREAEPVQAYETAVAEAIAHPERKARDALPARFCDGLPPLPDLGALSLRSCRQCGCTDFIGCSEGCWWVGADLCSRCADVGQPEGGRA